MSESNSSASHVRAFRRERVREYKDAFPPMGVFAVRNLANGRVFVGASRNVDGALNRLRFELQMRAHRNAALMHDWLSFGAENFRFEVIDRVRKRQEAEFDYGAELENLLHLWQEQLDCFAPKGYNAPAASLGVRT